MEKILTLEEQFKNLKDHKDERPAMVECHRLNNHKALQVLHYIIRNKCKLEHRQSLESDEWKPGTLREFLRFYISKPFNEPFVSQADNWMLNFWRIKTQASTQELHNLTHVEHENED